MVEQKHKWNDPRYVGGIDAGDKIYYKGDMANIPGWGIITKVVPCEYYHKTITIELEDGRVQNVTPYMLGCQTEVDKPIYDQGLVVITRRARRFTKKDTRKRQIGLQSFYKWIMN